MYAPGHFPVKPRRRAGSTRVADSQRPPPRRLPLAMRLVRLVDCHPPQSPGTPGGATGIPHGDGLHPAPRCADPQPQEHRPGPAARQADRDHRPVRLGQVLAGLRHHLCRGPAPLRRIAVSLCTPVPQRDGKAGYRPYRGPEPGDLDRTEVHQPQPALHRRHDHRDLRLPAPALCPRRHPALPGPWLPAGGADRQPDGGPGAGAGWRTALDAAGAGGA